MTDVEPLLTAREVGELAKMTAGAVLKAASRGQIPGAVHLGPRRVRFQPAAIRRWLQGTPIGPVSGERSVDVSAPNAASLPRGKSRASA